MPASASFATLEPVRFGEFLRDRALITEEQWLAALAEHWSAPIRRPIGATIVAHGFLSTEIVEAAARVFHDDLDVVDPTGGSAPRPAGGAVGVPTPRLAALEVHRRRDKPTVPLVMRP